MAAGTRRMVFEVAIDDSKTGKALQRMDRNVGNTADSFGKAGKAIKYAMGTVAAGAVVQFGKQMAEHAATMEAIERRTDTVFGSSAGTIRTWADDVNEAFGMSENGVLNLASSFGDLLIPMGFTREEAAQLSIETLNAANALSEWTGGQIDTATAAEAVSKAMLGEREMLKTLGISILEADVKQRLLEKGQNDLTGAALQQAKALATQELIFEKSTDALSAYADGADSALRQQKELAATTAELKDELAQRLLPALSEAVGFMGNAVNGVKVLVDWFDELPDGAKAAATGIAGLTAALAAVYANPVVAGLALVAGLVASIGKAAAEHEDAIQAFKDALEESGDAAHIAGAEFLRAKDNADTFDDTARELGTTLEAMARAEQRGGEEAKRMRDALKLAEAQGRISRAEYHDLTAALDGLQDATADVQNQLEAEAEAAKIAAIEAAYLEYRIGMTGGAMTGMAEETDEATLSLVELANQQRKAIDPAFALWDANVKYAQALRTKQDLERDGQRHTQAYKDATRALVEAQADLNWRTEAFEESSDDSIDALWNLGRQAGLAESDIWDLIAAIRQLNNTPVYGGATYDPGDLPPIGGGPIYLESGGMVPGPVGAPVPAVVHGGEMVLNPAQQRALFSAGSGRTDTINVYAGTIVTENQLEDIMLRVLAKNRRRNGLS